MKYQPYKGYGYAHPWLWYGLWAGEQPRRIRTKSDYVYNWAFGWCSGCRARHTYRELRGDPYLCDWHDCYWHKPHDSNAARFQKQLVHRQFRRQAKRLIQRELSGDDDVSQMLIVSGDYLD